MLEQNKAECNNPALVNPGDVAAVVEGEGRPEFIEHLKSCSFCQTEVADYRAIAGLLGSQLRLRKPVFQADCPPTQLLIDYACQLLPAAAQTTLQTHLHDCYYCQADYQDFRKEFESDTDTAPTVVAPWDFNLLFDTATGVIKKVIAFLVSPVPAPLASAVRSQAQVPSSPYQTYQAGEITVKIQIRIQGYKGQNLTVTGSIERPGYLLEGSPATQLPPLNLNLLQAETILSSGEIDQQDGSFYLEAKLEATNTPVRLEIYLPDQTVIIPALALDQK